MYTFDLDAVRRAMDAMDSKWKEFMRGETLSMGVYRLKVGEPDLQKPHTEDEVYVVLRGRATFVAGENRQSVSQGTVIFVEAGRDHRFVEIVEDIEAFVLFTPPEGSKASAQ